MAAMSPRSTTAPTTPDIDTASPWQQRAGTFLLRLLEELGSHPSVWDPWLFLTPHRAVKRTVARR
jgi:hypothetical protein